DETEINTFVERLDTNFLLDPRTRRTTEAAKAMEDASAAVQNSNPFAVNLELVVDELRLSVKGWEDKETDEKPMRTASGTLVPYSPENLEKILSVEEIVYVLAKATKDLAAVSETLDLGN
ncbi:hypothetical protein N9X87_00135, partial [bacterium]|nr:hypothetical protein [bacterium]